jgi:hypothetical protein
MLSASCWRVPCRQGPPMRTLIYRPSDPMFPLDAVEAKLAKNYLANCHVELLAHFGPLAWVTIAHI